MSSQPAAVRAAGESGQLHRGALSLTGAVMQGVTHIAPTAGVILILQAEVATIGLATPFEGGRHLQRIEQIAASEAEEQTPG